MSTASASEQLSRDLSMPYVHDAPYDAFQRTVPLRSEHSTPHSDVPPEHRLMIALLRDALRRVEKYRHARDFRGKRLFAQEAEWILSNDTSWIYAFARVCETLDLDPGAVRRSLGLVAGKSDVRPMRGATHSAPAPQQRSLSC